MLTYPRMLPCGDSGLSVEFGDSIDERTNGRVLAFEQALRRSPAIGIVETVPTYRALLIHYDPTLTSYEELQTLVTALATRAEPARTTGRRLRLPVCYEGDCAIDLADVADALGLAIKSVIDKHVAAEYRVYMLGFQPGFAYLGGLDPALSLPRRAKPRAGARAGTVSIAAGQCAVHAIDGPSGWHWIGRTPLETYRSGENPFFLFEPGDIVRLEPICIQRWWSLRRAQMAGDKIIGTLV